MFTHNLYGTSRSQFQNSLKFTFFHNYKLLYGEDSKLDNTISSPERKTLKKQIALEFLFKMYINILIQKSYNTIKLRSLFLHIKALHYDFEFLNVYPVDVLKLVNDGISLRNNWFNSKVSKRDVVNWFKSFFNTYQIFLIDLFGKYKMFAPLMDFKIAPNIFISNSDSLCFNKKGFVFPNPLNILDNKYFKILNRLNEFHFKVPLSIDAPEIVNGYFNYTSQATLYNKKYIPHFMTLTSSLKVYK